MANKTVKTNIQVDDNGRAILWFDCEFCKGVATVRLKNKKGLSTLQGMQNYHKNGHNGVIFSISG